MICRLCGEMTSVEVAHATHYPNAQPMCFDHAFQWHVFCFFLTEIGVMAKWTSDDHWWAEMNGIEL